jgi:sugar/nucleoside kinase (ribokinase family)
MKLLIVGSVAYDSVESAAGKVEYALGGAATFAAVAASFFTAPSIVGVVGDDFRQEDIKFLEGRGIDLSGLQHQPGKTFHWAGRYLPDMIGRETLDTQLNVFATFDPVLPPALQDPEFLLLANIHPGLQKRVLDQVKGPRFVLMDTMNLWIDTARDELLALLPRVDVLVINDEEVRQLTGHYNIIKGARELLAKVRTGVIVKRGEHGSTLFMREGLGIAPAFPVDDLIDPTGAGDSFAGALIGHLARSGEISFLGLRRAILHGAALASFTVEGFSLDPLRKISARDIDARVAAIKGLIACE